MSPLALLLFLLCSSLALASGSEPTLSWTCGDEQVSILETSDGRQNLSINGVLVKDRAQGCDRLRSYFGSGCLSCDERSQSWRGAWMRSCSDDGSQSSYVTSAPNIPRRLLKQSSENGAKAEDDPCGNTGLHENKHDANDSSKKEDPLLAVPGVLLLCCGLMLPCFHAERKEGRRQNTTSIQRNAGKSIHHVLLSFFLFQQMCYCPLIFGKSNSYCHPCSGIKSKYTKILVVW
uniref:Uncharacterized protein n=1 Tax=Aegilops tauschii subsp. strangulata TaxID=200361 RepID=A0A453KH50_AEGTS